jgi:hypothetical protein
MVSLKGTRGKAEPCCKIYTRQAQLGYGGSEVEAKAVTAVLDELNTSRRLAIDLFHELNAKLMFFLGRH